MEIKKENNMHFSPVILATIQKLLFLSVERMWRNVPALFLGAKVVLLFSEGQSLSSGTHVFIHTHTLLDSGTQLEEFISS